MQDRDESDGRPRDPEPRSRERHVREGGPCPNCQQGRLRFVERGAAAFVYRCSHCGRSITLSR